MVIYMIIIKSVYPQASPKNSSTYRNNDSIPSLATSTYSLTISPSFLGKCASRRNIFICPIVRLICILLHIINLIIIKLTYIWSHMI